jgi:hypothetical protein
MTDLSQMKRFESPGGAILNPGTDKPILPFSARENKPEPPDSRRFFQRIHDHRGVEIGNLEKGQSRACRTKTQKQRPSEKER